jgi:hypothetical protein
LRINLNVAAILFGIDSAVKSKLDAGDNHRGHYGSEEEDCLQESTIWQRRALAAPTTILILLVNSIVQAVLIWWPEAVGRAHGFLAGFTFAIALGFGVMGYLAARQRMTDRSA